MKINQLIDSAIVGKKLNPNQWSEELAATSVDLNEAIGTNFDSGIAYAATITKVIHFRYSEVKALLSAPGGIFKVVSAVKTQRNFTKIKETPSKLSLKLAIKVPVFPDFQTQDQIKIYEDSKGRGILEWKQVGEDAHLAYNRGAVVVEPAGDDCKIFVIGIHVIKRNHKIPWIGRGTARNFAKNHYANYVTALESSLSDESSRQSH